MTITSLIKSIQDIMRQDAGGRWRRTKNIPTCMDAIFKKYMMRKESEWEIFEENYKSIIPEDLRWRELGKKMKRE